MLSGRAGKGAAMILDGKATAAAIRAALREKIEKDREKAEEGKGKNETDKKQAGADD